jgi:[ribosomal protein S5]-alanine N-acetyltransferase
VTLAPLAPLLTDGVVRLRPFEQSDLAAIRRSKQDAEIRRWFAGPESAEEFLERKQRGWSEGRAASFAICDAHDTAGRCMGQVFLELGDEGRADVGYWLLEEHRGAGRATRAVRLVSVWALQKLGIMRLQLRTDPENVASQRVAERCGWMREGVLRSYNEIYGRRRDAVVYSLLPSDLDEGTFRQPFQADAAR